MRLPIRERLEGRGVVLRPLRPGDAGPYAAAFADDPELGRLLGVEDDPTPGQIAEKPASIEEGAAAGRRLELAIARVEMTTTPDNGPTRGLAAHLGFTEEGLLRGRNLERGQRVDLVMFGLLRAEWPPPQRWTQPRPQRRTHPPPQPRRQPPPQPRPRS